MAKEVLMLVKEGDKLIKQCWINDSIIDAVMGLPLPNGQRWEEAPDQPTEGASAIPDNDMKTVLEQMDAFELREFAKSKDIAIPVNMKSKEKMIKIILNED